MKFSIIILALIGTCMAACNSRKVKDEFESFKRQYRKAYKSPQEEAERCAIFAENYAKIETHNLKRARDASITWTLTINKFADYSTEEFIQKYGGLDPDLQLTENSRIPKRAYVPNPNYKADDEIDWRDLGKVTPIKDQSKCGSCWAFATVGIIESAWAIKYEEIINLSEQQLVECASTSKYGNKGCNGGLPKNALNYVLDNQGLNFEDDYPYISGDGNWTTDCQYDSTKRTIQIVSYTEVPKNDDDLANAVGLYGPVFVAVKAGHSSWQLYESGSLCENYFSSLFDKVDHAVIVVGYTVDDWIIKNSWGENWGRSGYIYMCRKIKNNGGITGNNGLFPGLTGIAPLFINLD